MKTKPVVLIASSLALLIATGTGVSLTMAAPATLYDDPTLFIAPTGTPTPSPVNTSTPSATPTPAPTPTRTILKAVGEWKDGMDKVINAGVTGVQVNFTATHVDVYVVGWTSGKPDTGWKMLAPDGSVINQGGWTCRGDDIGTFCPISDSLPISRPCQYSYEYLTVQVWGYDMKPEWKFTPPLCPTPTPTPN